MDLEYLIVGISKGETADFNRLYQAVAAKVYAVALATVKDKRLAQEIAVETFRRIQRNAYAFDTDYNAEYWMLDMTRQLSLNALRDPEICQTYTQDGLVDNASALVLQTIAQLKNERGLLLILHAMTDLSAKDIAKLSNFYRTSAAGEIRRGYKALQAFYPKVPKKTLRAALKEDFKEACPDFRDRIDLDRPTGVAHISHEAMFLSDEEMHFEAETEFLRIEARTKQKTDSRKRRLRIALVMIATVIVLAAGSGIIWRLAQDTESPTPDRAQTGAAIDMVAVDGVLYYGDAHTGVYAFQNGKVTLIHDAPVRDLVAGEDALFFRGYQDGKMYRLTLRDRVCSQVTAQSGTSLAYYNGYIYFNASDGIYKFPEDATKETVAELVYKEEVSDAPTRFHMSFTQTGALIFSAGADRGIYQVDGNDLHALYLDEAYDFQIHQDWLFFDAIGLRDVRYLYALRLNKTETDSDLDATLPEIRLYSAAYYVVGNTVYYEGFDEKGTNNGLYCLDITTGERTLIEAISQEALHITDMYAADGRLYCYYGDGTQNGTSTLLMRPLDNLDKKEVIF